MQKNENVGVYSGTFAQLFAIGISFGLPSFIKNVQVTIGL
jgi:hypothetical protein